MSQLYKDLYRTLFPENVDQFTQFLDILASDGPLVKAYQDAMRKGDQQLAKQLLESIPSYSQKVFTAQDLNKFLDAITALERFYKTDIKPYTMQKQAEWEEKVNEFSYKGIYSRNFTYKKNNYVSSGNLFYIATKDVPINKTPSIAVDYWRKFSVVGTKGDKGVGLVFNGEWEVGTWKPLDCVEHEGALWVNRQASTTQPPYDGSPYWKLLYKGKATPYPVSEQPPDDPENGSIWFEIV